MKSTNNNYDKITTSDKFDSSKDGQIVRAINAKTGMNKSSKTLAKIFANAIAKAL